MPPQIAALPREKRGFPVPYVANWLPRGGQRDEHIDIRTNIEYGLHDACSCKPGDPEWEPDLGQMCSPRQRRCMKHKRCQICTIKLEPPYLLIGSPKGDTDTWYTEPPVCTSCAAYALRVCPGLITNQRPVAVWACTGYDITDQRLFALPDGEPIVLRTEGDSPEVRSGCLTYFMAHPLDGEPVLADQWLHTFEQKGQT